MKHLFSLVALFTISAASAGEVNFKVPGMHCDGCTSSVKLALENLDGVEQVLVDLDSKEVVVRTDKESAVGRKSVAKAVETAGYDAEGIIVVEQDTADNLATLQGRMRAPLPTSAVSAYLMEDEDQGRSVLWVRLRVPPSLLPQWQDVLSEGETAVTVFSGKEVPLWPEQLEGFTVYEASALAPGALAAVHESGVILLRL